MSGIEQLRADCERAWEGYDSEAAERLADALPGLRDVEPALFAKACLGVAMVAWRVQEDEDRARWFVDLGLSRVTVDDAPFEALQLLNFSAFLSIEEGRLLEALPALLNVLRRAGEVDGAEGELTQAQCNLAGVLMHLGALDEAAAMHGEIRQRFDVGWEGRAEYALLMLHRGDVEEARALVAGLEDTRGKDLGLRDKILAVLQAWIAREDGRWDDVLAHVKRVLEAAPPIRQSEAIALWLCADAHLACARPAEAEAAARRGQALFSKPTGGLVHQELLTALVRALVAQGRHDDVVAELQERRAVIGGGSGAELAAGLLRMNVELVEARAAAESALEMQRELQAQGERAAMLEAVGQLSAGLTHDLHNLLTVIYASVDGLRAQRGAEDHAEELLEELEGASDAAARLGRGLLALTHQRTAPPETLGAHDVLRRAASLANERLRPGVAFSLELGEPAHVHVAAGALEQVLVNVVLNAQEAGATNVSLTQSLCSLDDGLLDDGLLDDDPERAAVCIRVVDDGSGMDSAVRERLFEPFFSTKQRSPGRGLGLTIFKRVAEQAGGRVEVRSEPGEGTTVELALPVAPNESFAPRSADVDARARPEDPVILLVEDEPLVRRSIERSLRRLGVEVWTANDGQAGLARFREGGDRVAAVITDLVMPLMSGVELARAIAEEQPSCPLFLMSGYSEEEALGDLLERSQVRFLAKPFRHSELIAHVTDVLAIGD